MTRVALVVWLALAAVVPMALWWMAPADAGWAGSDDRMGELASPAGHTLLTGPEWSPETERMLFWAQASAGALLLGGSVWALRRRVG